MNLPSVADREVEITTEITDEIDVPSWDDYAELVARIDRLEADNAVLRECGIEKMGLTFPE